MKKFLLLMLFTCLGFGMQAQTFANTKTVRIKGMYDFQTEFNEFRVNSYLKHRFEEYGFTVYYDMEETKSGKDDVTQSCDELICLVTRDKSMLATKLNINLINCKGEVVFTAKGESRMKLHSKAHVDALKNALEYSVLNKNKQ